MRKDLAPREHNTLYKYLHKNSINEVLELITVSKAGRTSCSSPWHAGGMESTTARSSKLREAPGREPGFPGQVAGEDELLIGHPSSEAQEGWTQVKHHELSGFPTYDSMNGRVITCSCKLPGKYVQ